MTTTSPTPMHERTTPVTTAPARPTLYGPDGQALGSTPTIAQPPAPTGDWKPVRSEAGATVWEKPAPQASPEVEYRERRLAELEARATVLDPPAPPPLEATPAHPAKPARTGRRWDLDKIGLWAALCFGIGLTASGEYELARFVGFNEWVSALLPAAIDVYVIQAFRRHRDTFVAISLMIATNVLVHLAHNGLFGVVDKVSNGRTVHAPHWGLIAAVSAIAPIIIWRVHRIGGLSNNGHDDPVPVPPDDPVPDVTSSPVPVPQNQQVTDPVPDAEPAPEAASVPPEVPPSVPALKAVPDTAPVPVPKRRSTGPRSQKRAARSTGHKTGTSRASTASFEEHVRIAAEWLSNDPSLSGTDIGKRLGTGDSYGRRVKRAVTSPEPQPTK